MSATTQTLDDMAGQDILDTRDITTRISDLEAELDDEDDAALEPEELEELEELRAIVDEWPSDWHDGEGLIREDYFEDYARELAQDIGAISGDEQWPLTYIDWESGPLRH